MYFYVAILQILSDTFLTDFTKNLLRIECKQFEKVKSAIREDNFLVCGGHFNFLDDFQSNCIPKIPFTG